MRESVSVVLLRFYLFELFYSLYFLLYVVFLLLHFVVF